MSDWTSRYARSEVDSMEGEEITLSTSQVKLMRSLQPLLKHTGAINSNKDNNISKEKAPAYQVEDSAGWCGPSSPDEPASKDSPAQFSTQDLHNLLDAALEVCFGPSTASYHQSGSNDLTSRLAKLLEDDTSPSPGLGWSSVAFNWEETPVVLKPSTLHRFPVEVLSCILKWAARLCTISEACPLCNDKEGNKSCNHTLDEPMTAPQVQEWLLSLSTVSKKWQEAIAQVVWRDLYIRDKRALYMVAEIFKQRPELVDLIVDKARISVKEPKHYMLRSVGNNAGQNGGWGNAPHGAGGGWGDAPQVAGNAWGGRLAGPTSDGSVRLVGPWDNVDSQDLIINFHKFATNLRNLNLDANGVMDSGLNPSTPRVVFTRPDLLDSFSAAALSSLELNCMMLFLDLEQLLLSTSSLRVLRITGGVDNADRRDIVPTQDHRNSFRQFAIVTTKNYGHIGQLQIAWLLRPAIGHLIDLELMLPANGGWDNGDDWNGGGGGGVQSQPFASNSFADVLALLAPTLRKLNINLNKYAVSAYHWEAVEPHNGNFSFALSNCTQLEHISMHWSLAGSGVTRALKQCVQLEKMDMSGSNIGVTGDEFCAAITQGAFVHLNEVRLRQFRLSPAPGGWGARDLKTFEELCKKRNITLFYP